MYPAYKMNNVTLVCLSRQEEHQATFRQIAHTPGWPTHLSRFICLQNLIARHGVQEMAALLHAHTYDS